MGGGHVEPINMYSYSTSPLIGQGDLQQCLSTYIPCVLLQLIQFALIFLILKDPFVLYCIVFSEELDSN